MFFLILSFYISQTYWGKGRFEQTSIFSVISGVTVKLNELIANEGQNKLIIARIFHNKIIGFGKELINQYLSYFSFNYLFIEGWKKSRYFIPEVGLLYLSFLPLIFTAIVNLKNYPFDKNKLFFFIFILLFSPLPAAFTVVESPNPHRSLFLMTTLICLSSFGIFELLKVKFKKINLGYIASLLLVLEFIFFLHQYFNHADLYSSIVRNDGQKEIAYYVIENENRYDQIFLPAEAAMSWYYLFYKKDFNPKYAKMFQLDTRIKNTGKVYYIENSCPTTIVNPDNFINKKVLIIDRYSCQSDDSRWRFIKTIHGVNSLLKYKLFEN
jgi:hypothetical protein